MAYLGFAAIEIAVLEDNKVKGDLIVIEGKQDKGATVSADISGLSSDPVSVYGSDLKYYVSQKGVGNPEAEISILDMPQEAKNIILGRETADETGLAVVGKDTEAPYCAVKLRTSTLQGDEAVIAMFKGKFSTEGISIKTKEEGNSEPESESFKFSMVASDGEKTKGQTLQEGVLAEGEAEKLNALLFPGLKETPTPS